MARTDLEQLVYQMSAEMKQLTAANKRALVDVKSTTTKAQREYDKLGAEMGRSFGRASTVAGVAFAAIMGYSVKAASDASETANAFSVAFGGLEKQAQAFAKSYSSDVGRALDETQARMAKTQLVLTGVGVAAKDALGMTEAIQRRSVDIGSLWNVSDAEAYQAILSGISGEAEPLKKFGVALNEAALKAELLRLGFKGNAQEAPEAAKAIARLNIILKASASADNDAIKTKDSLSNAVKRAQGEFRDAAVELGNNFLPQAANATKAAADLLGEFNKMPDGVKLAGLAFLGLVAAAGPIAALIAGLSNVIKVAGAARLAILAIPALPAVAAAAGPAGVAAATLSLGGDTRKFSAQDILNARLETEVQARKKIAEYEGKSGAAAEKKLKFWQGVLANSQAEIRDLHARERAEARSANRAAQRKKSASGEARLPTRAPEFGLSPNLLAPIKGAGSGAGSNGKKKATVDLKTGVATVDEDSVFDVVNNLGGARNALAKPDANPADFNKGGDLLAPVLDDLDRLNRSAADGLYDATYGALDAAFRDGAGGVLDYFTETLKRKVISELANTLVDSLQGKAGGAGLLGSIARFAGFFDGGGSIRSGQFGLVGERGPEFVKGPATVTGRLDTLRAIENAGTLDPRGGGGNTTITLHQTIDLTGANGDAAIRAIAYGAAVEGFQAARAASAGDLARKSRNQIP